MKTRLAIMLATLALTAACSKKSDSGAGAAPAPVRSESTLTLNIGSEMQPASNKITLTDNVDKGAVVTFVGHADRDGVVALRNGMAVAVNCNLESLPLQITLNSASSQNVQLTLPAQVPVKSGEDFSIKFELGANTCLQLESELLAGWLAAVPNPKPMPDPTPAPTPAPTRPTPEVEAGYLGEQHLDSMGGMISLSKITSDYVYSDYYFEVNQSSKVYKSVSAGSSSCKSQPTAKLELLEIAQDGKITKRSKMDYGNFLSVEPGKFYRLRYSLSGITGCYHVSESFNVGWL